MLPFEPHWYTALESIEQLVYEMVNGFNRYVKNPAPPVAQPAAASK
jgi:dipeptidyl aminopeptidase/acylaminoacyl peptidase